MSGGKELDKTDWIVYYYKTKHKGVTMYHTYIIDIKKSGIISFCTSNMGVAVLEMLKESLSKYPAPEIVYVPKGWVCELSICFPKVTFKNITSYPKNKRQIIDTLFAGIIKKIIKTDYPDALVEINHNNGRGEIKYG